MHFLGIQHPDGSRDAAEAGQGQGNLSSTEKQKGSNTEVDSGVTRTSVSAQWGGSGGKESSPGSVT